MSKTKGNSSDDQKKLQSKPRSSTGKSPKGTTQKKSGQVSRLDQNPATQDEQKTLSHAIITQAGYFNGLYLSQGQILKDSGFIQRLMKETTKNWLAMEVYYSDGTSHTY